MKKEQKVELVLNTLEAKIPGQVEEFFREFLHNGMPHVNKFTVKQLAEYFIEDLEEFKPISEKEIIDNLNHLIGQEGGNGFLGDCTL